MKCKATKELSRNDCPAFKYNGPMDRENLIQFFRSIELPLVVSCTSSILCVVQIINNTIPTISHMVYKLAHV